MKTLNGLTSNQYYYGLNRRFEKRAKLLISLGYSYERIPGTTIAVYKKAELGRKKLILAQTLLHASNRGFIKAMRHPHIESNW